jgi:hypothetical protein
VKGKKKKKNIGKLIYISFSLFYQYRPMSPSERKRNRALVNSMIEIFELVVSSSKGPFRLVLSKNSQAKWQDFLVYELHSKQDLEAFLISNLGQVRTTLVFKDIH